MPFTTEQFFEVFETYNRAIFPLQFFLIAAAVAALVAAARAKKRSGVLVSGLLALLWFWAGAVYHLSFFTGINPAAYLFGAMFIAEGFLLLYFGVWKKALSFRFEPGLDGALGLIFIVYALIVYPLIGLLFGRVYPAAPTFGAPCPSVIFTFGLFMWADKKLGLPLLVIPVLWTFIGASAASSFAVTEDFGLLAAGTIGTAFIIRRRFAEEKGPAAGTR